MNSTAEDWPTTVQQFHHRFSRRIVTGSRIPKIPGRNFITPDILGYVRTADGAAEISTGYGISGERVYGVTFAPNEFGADPRSTCCHSWGEVQSIVRDPWQFPTAETREVALTLDNDPDSAEAVSGLREPMELRNAVPDLDNNGVRWWWIAAYRAAREQ